MKCLSVILGLFFCVSALQAQEEAFVTQSGHSSRVRAIAFNAKRQLAATASEDRTVRLWSTSTESAGTLIKVLTGHSEAVTGVAFDPTNSNQIASCSEDGTVRLWNYQKEESIQINIAMSPACLVFRPGSSTLTVGSSREGRIALINSIDGSVVDRSFRTGAPVVALAYSADGSTMVCGLRDGSVEIYEFATRTLKRRDVISKQSIRSIAVRGDRVVAVTRDGVLGFIRGTQEPVMRSIMPSVASCSFSDDADSVVMSDGASQVMIVDVETGVKRKLELGNINSVEVCIVRGEEVVAYGTSTEGQRSWIYSGLEYGQTIVQQAPCKGITALAFSSGGETLVSGDDAGAVVVWPLSQRVNPYKIVQGLFKHIGALIVTPDQSRVVIGGMGQNSLVVADLATGNAIRSDNTASAIDGAALVGTNLIAFRDARMRTVHLIDIDKLDDARFVMANVDAMCSDAEGRFIAGAANGGVRVFSLAKDTITLNYKFAFDGDVTAATILDDGTTMIVGTNTGTIFRVDLQLGTGRVVASSAHNGAVLNLERRPDGFLSAGADGKAISWSREGRPFVLRTNALGLSALARESAHDIVATGGKAGDVVLQDGSSTSIRITLVPTIRGWLVHTPSKTYDVSSSIVGDYHLVRDLTPLPISASSTMRRINDLLQRDW